MNGGNISLVKMQNAKVSSIQTAGHKRCIKRYRPVVDLEWFSIVRHSFRELVQKKMRGKQLLIAAVEVTVSLLHDKSVRLGYTCMLK